jgi:hypothetical protein
VSAALAAFNVLSSLAAGAVTQILERDLRAHDMEGRFLLRPQGELVLGVAACRRLGTGSSI